MNDIVIDTSDGRMIYACSEFDRLGYSTTEYSQYRGTDPVIYIFSPAKKFKGSEIRNFVDGSVVIAGNIDWVDSEDLRTRGIAHINLLKDEVYAYENAIYTAEVALMFIIRNTEYSIYDTKMLIMGYGRVGKAMANLLKTLGVDFAISARRYEERASAYLVTSDIRGMDAGYDDIGVIINTIPARVMTKDDLRAIKKDCYILDLASYSAIDEDNVNEMALKYAVEHGLPGRYTPRSAGKSLVQAVLRSIGE